MFKIKHLIFLFLICLGYQGIAGFQLHPEALAPENIWGEDGHVAEEAIVADDEDLVLPEQEDPQANLNARFLEAACENDMEELQGLILEGAEVDTTNCYGENALHCATDAGVVRFLLMSGVDRDAQSHIGAHENPELAEMGFCVLPYYLVGGTPLHYAMNRENVDCVRVLLESGADASLETEYEFMSAYQYAEDYMEDTEEGDQIRDLLMRAHQKELMDEVLFYELPYAALIDDEEGV